MSHLLFPFLLVLLTVACSAPAGGVDGLGNKDRCDSCGKFVPLYTLLADTEKDQSICAKCWKKRYQDV